MNSHPTDSPEQGGQFVVQIAALTRQILDRRRITLHPKPCRFRAIEGGKATAKEAIDAEVQS